MRAYRNRRFIQYPNLADIHREGRKTSVGQLPVGAVWVYYPDRVVCEANKHVKVKRHQRGICSSSHKTQVRRYLKRQDRAREMKFQQLAEL